MSISTAIEIVVIFLLILANGFFAASEIAVVSGRRGRLQQQADAGKTRARQALDLKMLARKPLFVSENHYADDLLTTFGHTGIHMALVLNESSQVIGLVTLEDLMEELVGEIQSEYQARDEQAFAQRVDGSWLATEWSLTMESGNVLGSPLPTTKSLGTIQPWLNSSLCTWDIIQRWGTW